METVNSLSGTQPAAAISKEELKSIKQPVMFIWGTNDPTGKTETVREYSELIPTSEFHPMQNEGHLTWLDNPTECGQLINNYLNAQDETED